MLKSAYRPSVMSPICPSGKGQFGSRSRARRDSSGRRRHPLGTLEEKLSSVSVYDEDTALIQESRLYYT